MTEHLPSDTRLVLHPEPEVWQITNAAGVVTSFWRVPHGAPKTATGMPLRLAAWCDPDPGWPEAHAERTATPRPDLTWSKALAGPSVRETPVSTRGSSLARTGTDVARTSPRFAIARGLKDRISATVQNSPGLSLAELLERMPHHYQSQRAAGGAVRRWVHRASIPNVRATWSEDGHRFRLWPRQRQVDPAAAGTVTGPGPKGVPLCNGKQSGGSSG